MFPTAFTYHRAESVADAVTRLAANPDAKILAGGHSLIPAMKLRLAQPAMLIDLGRVSDLKGVSIVDGAISMGAMTTYNELRDAEGVAAAFPAIAESINVIGDQQVRAHGTIGGTLAHNDPAADFTAVFLALGGSVDVTGSGGERSIAADDLFVDLWTTSLEPDEIITRIHIPAGGARSAYAKHSHPASGYAVVGVAVALAAQGGPVTRVSVVVTGATSKPTHATAAEEALAGKALDAQVIADAAAVADGGLEINGDSYASEEYKAQLIKVLARRALEAAANR